MSSSVCHQCFSSTIFSLFLFVFVLFLARHLSNKSNKLTPNQVACEVAHSGKCKEKSARMVSKQTPLSVFGGSFVVALMVATLLAQFAACRPTTQPLELSENQIGFSSETDQRKYLDIGDHKWTAVNLSEIWNLPRQDEWRINETHNELKKSNQTNQLLIYLPVNIAASA